MLKLVLLTAVSVLAWTFTSDVQAQNTRVECHFERTVSRLLLLVPGENWSALQRLDPIRQEVQVNLARVYDWTYQTDTLPESCRAPMEQTRAKMEEWLGRRFRHLAENHLESLFNREWNVLATMARRWPEYSARLPADPWDETLRQYLGWALNSLLLRLFDTEWDAYWELRPTILVHETDWSRRFHRLTPAVSNWQTQEVLFRLPAHHPIDLEEIWFHELTHLFLGQTAPDLSSRQQEERAWGETLRFLEYLRRNHPETVWSERMSRLYVRIRSAGAAGFVDQVYRPGDGE